MQHINIYVLLKALWMVEIFLKCLQSLPFPSNSTNAIFSKFSFYLQIYKVDRCRARYSPCTIQYCKIPCDTFQAKKTAFWPQKGSFWAIGAIKRTAEQPKVFHEMAAACFWYLMMTIIIWVNQVLLANIKSMKCLQHVLKPCKWLRQSPHASHNFFVRCWDCKSFNTKFILIVNIFQLSFR